MPTTPYLLDPVLCCGSFSASSKLAHVRSQPPVTDGRRLIELASLENETTHELKSRKRYWQPCLLSFEHRFLYNLVTQAKHSKQTSCEQTFCAY